MRGDRRRFDAYLVQVQSGKPSLLNLKSGGTIRLQVINEANEFVTGRFQLLLAENIEVTHTVIIRVVRVCILKTSQVLRMNSRKVASRVSIQSCGKQTKLRLRAMPLDRQRKIAIRSVATILA